MNIPPKATSHRPRLNGKTTGLAAALRTLNKGDSLECPQEWECGLASAAKRIGIKIATRRLGSNHKVTVYRTE